MELPDPGVFLVDAQTPTVTTLFRLPGHQVYALARNRGRNVATRRVGPGRWAVTLSFPGEAGNGYLAALNLSGTRPGFTLSDRRHVSFNLDNLTALSITGGLGAIFGKNIGVLDSQGEAQANLDVTNLPPLSGVRLWIQVLTQSPMAPNGIRTVPDPITLLL